MVPQFSCLTHTVGTEPGVGGFRVWQAQFSVKQSVPVKKRRINKKSNLFKGCDDPTLQSPCAPYAPPLMSHRRVVLVVDRST